MEVVIINKTDKNKEKEYAQCFKRIAETITTRLQLPSALECAVVFVSDSEIRKLNRDYRNVDAVTDVISFAIKDSTDDYQITDEVENSLGDIFIGLKQAEQQALEYGHSLKREVEFLFVHGLLHLLGYDHDSEKEEKVMFALQKEVLNEVDKKV